MDWPGAETGFNDNDFDNFKYEPRQFKIIKKLWTDPKPKRWNIKSQGDLGRWISKHKSSIRGGCEYGTYSILFSRDSNSDYSTPSYLPTSRAEFSELVDLFHIHPTIVRTIRRETAQFSRMHLHEYEGDSIVYTGRMCSTWPNGIAMSSVYLHQKRLNLSVFYGCNKDQMNSIYGRLCKAGTAIYHPMLASGILVELDRKRLIDQIESVTSNFEEIIQTFSSNSQVPESIFTDNFIGQDRNVQQLPCLYIENRLLAKGVRIVKHQILGMIQHTYELERMPNVTPRSHKSLDFGDSIEAKQDLYPEQSNMGLRIRERLIEIRIEYDQKLDQCHMVLDGLGFTTQLASNLANIRIAIDAKRENTQMKSIALVTMVFLPLTTVASVFSMGVFNWEPTAEQAVLSFYFWVYIAVAAGLTLLTIGTWWAFTRARQSDCRSAIGAEGWV